MNHYRSYCLEDFARDESFRRWVLEHESESTLFWNEWLKLNPDCKETVNLARAFLLALEEKDTVISFNELEEITENILSASPRPVITFWQSTLFRMAASIVLMLGIALGGAYMYYQNTAPVADLEEKPFLPLLSDKYREAKNETNRPQQIKLHDGSVVTLYPQSSLRYPVSFEAIRREVYLNGKAFFEIVKNPQKPFWVYTEAISTQVLGTSFMVNAFAEANEAKVEVKTGKVSVYTRKDLEKAKLTHQNATAGVVLTPNQQVAFLASEERLLKSIVEAPQAIVKAPTQDFIFDEAPIAQVFDFLEKIYGVSVIYDAKNMEACYLTANLSDESLFDKLNLICKITHSTYEMVDAQIIIHSKGCK